MPILQNAIYYAPTDEILISLSRHDFVQSKDGKVAVDGGFEYLKRSGETDLIEDLSITTNTPLEERYDKLVLIDWKNRKPFLLKDINKRKLDELREGMTYIGWIEDIFTYRELILKQ